MSQTLLDKAAHNYNIAVIAQTMDGDEAYLNYVGYHLQQSVELALKFQLEECGVQYPKTHDIDQLIRISRENELNLYIPEYIEEHAEMLSLWESRTRYVLDCEPSPPKCKHYGRGFLSHARKKPGFPVLFPSLPL